MKKDKKTKFNITDEEVGKYEPISFSKHKAEMLKDPEFKKVYNALGGKLEVKL